MCARPCAIQQQPHADLLTVYGFAVSAIITIKLYHFRCYVLTTIQPCKFIQIVKFDNQYSKTSEQGHIGDRPFVLCREVVLFSEVLFETYWKFLKDNLLSQYILLNFFCQWQDGKSNNTSIK